ncbi:hypothetical protein ACGF5O_35495 [Streptomyces sp. NPDC048291]|uniref:hypothetical protein n=1 Tax=Streptomyces sp. NPDC048291 TaxID=3365530 RepID=UPI00371DB97C
MNDDELLTLLRAADPALTSRAPLPDIDRLVEDALSTESVALSDNNATGIGTPAAKATAVKGRRRVFGLAAAAALLLGGGVTAGIAAHSGNGGATAAGTPLQLTGAHSTTPAKCAEIVPDRLAGYPTVFYGRVTSVKGPLTTFHVDHWLRGGGPRTVLLNYDADVEHLTFSVGEHYIVAADDRDTVPMCGANWMSGRDWKKFSQEFGK